MGTALIDIRTTETLYLDSFPGVEVEVQTAVSMRDFMALGKLADMANPDDMEQAIWEFGEKFITGWNVSLNGASVKPSGETFAKMPVAFQLELTNKWLSSMRGPGAPLGQESSSGLDSQTQSTEQPDNE